MKFTHFTYNFFRTVIVLLAILFSFSSCKNDIKNVIKISEAEKIPDLLGEELYMKQSENGKTIFSVYAKKFVKFTKANIKQTEFPLGIKVVHFKNFPDTLSMISADYAINLDDKAIWEAKGNVIAKNSKNEILNTEYLIWDQNKRMIYSTKQVQVTTPDDIIIGQGFESDDQFNNWKIENVIGVFTLDEGAPETIEE